MKIFFYIIILFLTSCLNYQGPFQNEKSPLLISEHKIFGIHISETIGLSNLDKIELKELISSELRSNNILASEKIFNKNSYILRSTAIRYKLENKFVFLWNFSHASSDKIINFKTEVTVQKKYFKLNLNLIAKDISNKISQYFHKPQKKRTLIINNINIFQNQKPLEKIFIKKLINNIELKNLNILLTENKNNISQNDNLRILDIKIEKILYKDEEEIKINWMISNKEGKSIGSIKQSKLIKKGLIDKFWLQISDKIIEMALLDLNYLTWVD